jgi:hypothetical protein
LATWLVVTDSYFHSVFVMLPLLHCDTPKRGCRAIKETS